jgi:hypothetical protein
MAMVPCEERLVREDGCEELRLVVSQAPMPRPLLKFEELLHMTVERFDADLSPCIEASPLFRPDELAAGFSKFAVNLPFPALPSSGLPRFTSVGPGDLGAEESSSTGAGSSPFHGLRNDIAVVPRIPQHVSRGVGQIWELVEAAFLL